VIHGIPDARSVAADASAACPAGALASAGLLVFFFVSSFLRFFVSSFLRFFVSSFLRFFVSSRKTVGAPQRGSKRH
jgi:hypothetical protein